MSKQDPLDVAIGAEIRTRRKAAGLSLEKLGEAIGVTYQQIQKYETGANRVSAATLVRLGDVLPGGHMAIMSAATGASAPDQPLTEPEDRLAFDRLAARLGSLSAAARRKLMQNFADIATAAAREAA